MKRFAAGLGRSLGDAVADCRGSAITLVVIAMLALMAAVALAIDVGKLTAARAESQRAADAGALAAASAYIDDPDNADAVAKARAEEYAELQTVRGDTVVLVPAEDVLLDVDNYRVEVTVRNIAARSNAVTTFFARVLGINTVDIQTHAVAEAAPAGRVGCLLPIALPDMWADTLADEKWNWDDGNRDNIVAAPDTWEPYRPCSPGAAPETFEPSNCTSWGGPWRNMGEPGYTEPQYKFDVGRPITIKPGNPHQAMQPGWFFPWRAVGDAGGADYEDSIVQCVDPETLFAGNEFIEVDVEPGNMIGPTIHGFEARVGDDPNSWTDGCTAGMSCITPDGAAYAGPRLVHVPLIDPTTVVQPGMQSIKFTGFARMFINDISSNDIEARWLRLGGNPGATGGEGNAGALPLYVRLVE
jgi:Flp pilus assembly protein TadG